MKSLRIIGSIVFGLFLLANLVAPVEVQGLVPPSVHDFVFGPEGVTMGMATVSLSNMSRKERQKANLGGIAKLYLLAASDFTADWPAAADVVAGSIAGPTIPCGAKTWAVVTFDIGTCRVKSDRKGKLGYQNVGVSGECKMAGYDATQITALEKTFNEGGVAIVVYKDGTRVVYGSSNEPLEFEDSTDSGAKADDQLAIDFKFKGDGYAFHPPLLAPAVTVALSTT
ncbi:hypothetical protein GO730_00585 [Spirosoma sp. HMF3257]|uniref:Uncharacterized protein n=1 Tax=Spirosoma telluris TaxID=2183553 RepID=A0A327NH64_9BACT|nr:hypothetical protein [Spirosoma telluris]RAI73296.1 hypothetical protein HMF3257_00570 [Spirosoma telluris]